jgi:hypothetical protein
MRVVLESVEMELQRMKTLALPPAVPQDSDDDNGIGGGAAGVDDVGGDDDDDDDDDDAGGTGGAVSLSDVGVGVGGGGGSVAAEVVTAGREGGGALGRGWPVVAKMPLPRAADDDDDDDDDDDEAADFFSDAPGRRDDAAVALAGGRGAPRHRYAAQSSGSVSDGGFAAGFLTNSPRASHVAHPMSMTVDVNGRTTGNERRTIRV